MKIDLVLQGPLYSYTQDIVSKYLLHPLVNNVIISCWKSCNIPVLESNRVILVKNEDVEYPGVGNINRQIHSSREGLKHVSLDYCAKMRTDQVFSHSALDTMDSFYRKFSKNEIHYQGISGPSSPIFVLGMYKDFPFHPRDHIFWGSTKDLKKLFDIPFLMQPKEVVGKPIGSESYWNHVVRPESYIGGHYYSLFDSRVSIMMENYAEYFTDVSPKKEEALNIYNNLRDKVFKVFPRIDFSWPKHNLKNYHFHVGEVLSEYWYEESW